ncbi:MAG: hypothetical protein ACOYMG_03905 [Candidatus Methylumidiphilus sp.]
MTTIPSYLVISDNDILHINDTDYLHKLDEPAFIHSLKLNGIKIAELLESEGASPEWFEALTVLDLGEDMSLKPYYSKPFPKGGGYLREIKILAYIRWLIENYQGETGKTCRYREVSNYVKSAIEANYTGEILPYAEQGKASVTGGRKGHETVHGTQKEKAEAWKSYQDKINEYYAISPRLTYQQMQEKAANHFDVSTKTIQRHTVNPKGKK